MNGQLSMPYWAGSFRHSVTKSSRILYTHYVHKSNIVRQTDLQTFLSRHFSNCVFCNRTPNHIVERFARHGCWILSICWLSGRASTQCRLDTTLARSPWSERVPNPGGKFAYDATGVWHVILHRYPKVSGSNRLWNGSQKDAHSRPKTWLDGVVPNFCY